jgi:hypothetical protein
MARVPIDKTARAAVVLGAEAYQRPRDIAARADPKEGIRQGLEEARRGKGRPVREFFAEFTARRDKL